MTAAVAVQPRPRTSSVRTACSAAEPCERGLYATTPGMAVRDRSGASIIGRPSYRHVGAPGIRLFGRMAAPTLWSWRGPMGSLMPSSSLRWRRSARPVGDAVRYPEGRGLVLETDVGSVSAAAEAVSGMSLSALVELAVLTGWRDVGPWVADAAETVAVAYRQAEARAPIAEALDDRFGAALHSRSSARSSSGGRRGALGRPLGVAVCRPRARLP